MEINSEFDKGYAMETRAGMMKQLETITTMDLWAELGRRFNVKYGKIQMAFHGGRPSDCTSLEMRVSLGDEVETKAKRSSRVL